MPRKGPINQAGPFAAISLAARDMLVGGREGTVMEKRGPAWVQERDTFGETEAQRGRVVPRVHIIGSGRANNGLHLESLTHPQVSSI